MKKGLDQGYFVEVYISFYDLLWNEPPAAGMNLYFLFMWNSLPILDPDFWDFFEERGGQKERTEDDGILAEDIYSSDFRPTTIKQYVSLYLQGHLFPALLLFLPKNVVISHAHIIIERLVNIRDFSGDSDLVMYERKELILGYTEYFDQPGLSPYSHYYSGGGLKIDCFAYLPDADYITPIIIPFVALPGQILEVLPAEIDRFVLDNYMLPPFHEPKYRNLLIKLPEAIDSDEAFFNYLEFFRVQVPLGKFTAFPVINHKENSVRCSSDIGYANYQNWAAPLDRKLRPGMVLPHKARILPCQ